MPTPVVILAVANDQQHSLRQLAQELDELSRIFEEAEEQGYLKVKTLAAATPANLIRLFFPKTVNPI